MQNRGRLVPVGLWKYLLRTLSVRRTPASNAARPIDRPILALPSLVNRSAFTEPGLHPVIRFANLSIL